MPHRTRIFWSQARYMMSNRPLRSSRVRPMTSSRQGGARLLAALGVGPGATRARVQLQACKILEWRSQEHIMRSTSATTRSRDHAHALNGA
eukprot:5108987-Alexandrium_andersonii.AAC.1